MKFTKKLSIGEFAALGASRLRTKGIETVLSGGAVVSIYTNNKYMSYDADFISPNDHQHVSKNLVSLTIPNQGFVLIFPFNCDLREFLY